MRKMVLVLLVVCLVVPVMAARIAQSTPEVTVVHPVPQVIELPPVFVDHCADNFMDCARAADNACRAYGGTQSAQLAFCPNGVEGQAEGCCKFECGAQGGSSTASGTCSAG